MGHGRSGFKCFCMKSTRQYKYKAVAVCQLNEVVRLDVCARCWRERAVPRGCRSLERLGPDPAAELLTENRGDVRRAAWGDQEGLQVGGVVTPRGQSIRVVYSHSGGITVSRSAVWRPPVLPVSDLLVTQGMAHGGLMRVVGGGIDLEAGMERGHMRLGKYAFVPLSLTPSQPRSGPLSRLDRRRLHSYNHRHHRGINPPHPAFAARFSQRTD